MTIITSHIDADGLTAAYLYSFTVSAPKIYLNEFGGVEKGSKVVLDMHPLSEPEFSGLVIDHHPDHPKKHAYKLIYDIVPTSVIVFNHYKDKIPEEEWWKVVCGAVGDMEPYSVPNEIWDKFPILRERFTQLYGYKHTPYSLRIYQKLSSGLNALMRMGRPDIALDLIEEVQSPIELITDTRCQEAQEELRKETNYQLEHLKLTELKGVFVGYIDSDYKIEGRAATQLSKQLNETVVIQNLDTGAFSIRGDLANYIQYKLKQFINEEISIEIGGHAQAKGGTIEPEDTRIGEILLKILYN